MLDQFVRSVEQAFEPARELLVPILSDPAVLTGWAVLVAVTLGVLWWDLWNRNEELGSLMKAVWTLVVLYSGPFGLAVYWYTGRTQIPHDSIWRRGFRSTAHCYSGCGAGEVTGFVLMIGVLAVESTLLTAAATFSLAYLFGFALTVGPLMQDGVGFSEAVMDALYSETPSITIMEIAAIGTDLLLAGGAKITEPLFWGGLAFSLSVGFLAAYPVNVGLIVAGVKEGMSNPAEMGDDTDASNAQGAD
ncbi:DUF4396 domain-containing protein [Halogeometricum limi]|uniref:DUF4396 domain-containing protein n=1 Tax=Halogeometricum limi TaxID=555875 RepID=A0A1I6H577_9EURY|nr:DUF4396 domain-containing protein [Halogeometricum limi]SFR49623.1 protein of unknown function [Halogeometricum limi]